MPTNISWAEDTSNPVTGCDDASPGCRLCYARIQSLIRASNPNPAIAAAYAGLVEFNEAGELTWTGKVNLHPERLDALYDLPLNRRRLIFMVSMGDLFHPAVPTEFIAKVFATMARIHWHTFQILTKRHARMRALLSSHEFRRAVGIDMVRQACGDPARRPAVYRKLERGPVGTRYDNEVFAVPSVWPLPNVWAGVSVEDQQRAELRLPSLVETPAAVRWISLEPQIGEVDLSPWIYGEAFPSTSRGRGVGGMTVSFAEPAIRWVVVGGESGVLIPTEKQPVAARPASLDWFRLIRYQCEEAGVAFHAKQLGTVLARDLGRPGHGKKLEDFPQDLRIREYPFVPEAVAA